MFNLLNLKILSDIAFSILLAVTLALHFFQDSISGTLHAVLGGGVFFALLSVGLSRRQDVRERDSTVVRVVSRCRLLPFCLVLLVIVIKTALHLYPTWWLGIESLFWPSTNGIIVDTELFQKPTKGKGSLWQPLVAYEYSIDGHAYQGRTLSFRYFVLGKAWAKQQIQDFTPGNAVVVYYRPSKPEKACLKPGPGIRGTIFAVLVLPMILLILYQSIGVFRNRPQNQSSESDG